MGSKRLPKKNLRTLAGRPLVVHALTNAYDSGVFSEIYISTDSAEIAEVAVSWTGCKHIQRPPHLATDESPDIDWVRHALGTIEHLDHKGSSVCVPCSLGHGHWGTTEMCILRPTSPFLSPETLQRAKQHWNDIKGSLEAAQRRYRNVQEGHGHWERGFDSMRAIRRASEPAWKQWRFDPETFEIDPLTSVAARKHLHSRPTQTLEDCWIQTAGLEMCWTRTPLELGSIAGERVSGFVLEGPEALDINSAEDWERAEDEAVRRAAAAMVLHEGNDA